MKKRKFLAALLAVACAASLAVPAFAEPEVPEDLSTEGKEAVEAALGEEGNGLVVDGGTVGGIDIEATVQKPTIAVVLPKTVKVFVNPYRAEVATGKDGEGEDIKSIDTVVSPEMKVVNGSNCAVKVSVKGQFVTYKFVETAPTGTAIADSGSYSDKDDIKITGWDTLSGSPVDQTAGLINDGTSYYAKVNVGTTDDPEYQYRLVTVKYTAGKDATATAAVVPKTYAISGYAATANIKVATAAVKEDTDKTNSIFMYVEGTDTSGKYPAAYNKAVAGVDAKGNVIVGGQYALAAKEGSGAVLYLGGNGTTGYMRVTGSAATAPTKTWTEVEETEGFETPFVFIVDPVANAAENPELKTMAVATTGVTLKSALASGKYTYDLTVPQTTTKVELNISADGTVGKGEMDGTVVTGTSSNFTASSTKLSFPVSASAAVNSKGTVTYTVTSAHGKVNTYTFNVTITAAP